MRISRERVDRRNHRGVVSISDDDFECHFETDWKGEEDRGVCPKDICIAGLKMSHLKFGFAAPWNWALDLNVAETEAGPMVLSQGFRRAKGEFEELREGRIPFLRTHYFFWQNPEMLYEVAEAFHLARDDVISYKKRPCLPCRGINV